MPSCARAVLPECTRFAPTAPPSAPTPPHDSSSTFANKSASQSVSHSLARCCLLGLTHCDKRQLLWAVCGTVGRGRGQAHWSLRAHTPQVVDKVAGCVTPTPNKRIPSRRCEVVVSGAICVPDSPTGTSCSRILLQNCRCIETTSQHAAVRRFTALTHSLRRAALCVAFSAQRSHVNSVSPLPPTSFSSFPVFSFQFSVFVCMTQPRDTSPSPAHTYWRPGDTHNCRRPHQRLPSSQLPAPTALFIFHFSLPSAFCLLFFLSFCLFAFSIFYLWPLQR